ncbi:SMI1/KNR4 family protein [Flavobacterium profundi]|uniref:SMI1/KNR4 family protein n=1 Tax=Flavobacterium profundi TaxID=1774945 RepID=UPI0012F96A30|nr:SMI1/KNR4 family protein [Flavobacterium profundi]
MKEILLTLSLVSIELGDVAYSEKQLHEKWIGFEPATNNQIQAAEKRLSVDFPKDYIDFLNITNGLSVTNDVQPSFMKVEDIDYLKIIDPFLVEVWSGPEIWKIGQCLERSILIGGKEEEQYFLLIPPKEKDDNWRYWTFASWRPGEEEFLDLKSYFESVIEFNKNYLKN